MTHNFIINASIQAFKHSYGCCAVKKVRTSARVNRRHPNIPSPNEIESRTDDDRRETGKR